MGAIQDVERSCRLLLHQICILLHHWLPGKHMLYPKQKVTSCCTRTSGVLT